MLGRPQVAACAGMRTKITLKWDSDAIVPHVEDALRVWESMRTGLERVQWLCCSGAAPVA